MRTSAACSGSAGSSGTGPGWRSCTYSMMVLASSRVLSVGDKHREALHRPQRLQLPGVRGILEVAVLERDGVLVERDQHLLRVGGERMRVQGQGHGLARGRVSLSRRPAPSRIDTGPPSSSSPGYSAISARATPLDQPKPSCSGYSPPPPPCSAPSASYFSTSRWSRANRVCTLPRKPAAMSAASASSP